MVDIVDFDDSKLGYDMIFTAVLLASGTSEEYYIYIYIYIYITRVESGPPARLDSAGRRRRRKNLAQAERRSA